MGDCVSFFSDLHRKTQRDYIGRMMDEKIHCMDVAREYGEAFWDGDRRYGYGGYRYDGRWKVVAEQLIERYGLTASSRVLDVGCGKAFLLYEIQELLPGIDLVGIDPSEYGLQHAKAEFTGKLLPLSAEKPYPFTDNYFDLVISLTTLHNLRIASLVDALREIQRVGKNHYFVVESYRNTNELFNLQCWALTCESFFAPEEWEWIMHQSGYTGDYEFIYFE